jgi:hypothetical protein
LAILRTQSGTATGAPRLQYLSAVGGATTRAKAVGTGALQPAGFKRLFHLWKSEEGRGRRWPRPTNDRSRWKKIGSLVEARTNVNDDAAAAAKAAFLDVYARHRARPVSGSVARRQHQLHAISRRCGDGRPRGTLMRHASTTRAHGRWRGGVVGRSDPP